MSNRFESGPERGPASKEIGLEVLRSPKKPNLNLVGITSGGKSSIGKAVAEKLGMKFIDADKVFEERNGTVTSVVAAEGWDGMRKREKQLVQELSIREEDTVIAWGGGVVEDDEYNKDQRNENAIHLAATGVTVWIEVTPKEAARRANLVENPNRPPDDDVEKTYTDRLTHREASYANVSDYKVSNEGSNPQDAIDTIVCAVKKQGILKDKEVIAI